MSNRRFRMIGQGVWQSRRFRALPDDPCRFAYLYILTTRHNATCIGAFYMPGAYMAHDMKWKDIAEAERAIREIQEVGLIMHDPEEDLVSIDNWFEFNAIGSRKQLAGALKAINELPEHSFITTHTYFTTAVAMAQRVATWSSDAAEGKSEALHMLATALVEHRAVIGQAAWEEGFLKLPPADQEHLRLSLPIDLPIGVSEPLPIQRDKIEKEKEIYIEKEIENNTDTVQDAIAGLNAKVRRKVGNG